MSVRPDNYLAKAYSRFHLPPVAHSVSFAHLASKLAADLSVVADKSGVYVFYALPDAKWPEPLLGLASQGEVVPVYVGQTGDSLRYRLKQHLHGDVRVSSIRAGLGLIAQEYFGVRIRVVPGSRYFFLDDEMPIQNWIEANLFVGLTETAFPREVEAEWLAIAPGVLNIAGRAPTAITDEIRRRRKLADGRRIPLSRSLGGRTSLRWLPGFDKVPPLALSLKGRKAALLLSSG